MGRKLGHDVTEAKRRRVEEGESGHQCQRCRKVLANDSQSMATLARPVMMEGKTAWINE